MICRTRIWVPFGTGINAVLTVDNIVTIIVHFTIEHQVFHDWNGLKTNDVIEDRRPRHSDAFAKMYGLSELDSESWRVVAWCKKWNFGLYRLDEIYHVSTTGLLQPGPPGIPVQKLENPPPSTKIPENSRS